MDTAASSGGKSACGWRGKEVQAAFIAAAISELRKHECKTEEDPE